MPEHRKGGESQDGTHFSLCGHSSEAPSVGRHVPPFFLHPSFISSINISINFFLFFFCFLLLFDYFPTSFGGGLLRVRALDVSCAGLRLKYIVSRQWHEKDEVAEHYYKGSTPLKSHLFSVNLFLKVLEIITIFALIFFLVRWILYFPMGDTIEKNKEYEKSKNQHGPK